MASTTPNNSALINPQVCVLLNKNIQYHGIFSSGSPLDYIVPVFMLQVILSVVISRLFYIILRPLKQSKLVCNILAGLILGPSVLGRSKSYMEKMFAPKEMIVTATMSNLASNLFIFLVYIKMDTAMLSQQGKKTRRIGLSCIIFPFLFTVSFTSLLHRFLPGMKGHNTFRIQFSIVSSLSYFIVIAHALDELNLLSSELGQLSTSITTLNEIVSGLTIMVEAALVQEKAIDSLYAILSLCGLIAFAIFVVRPVLLQIIKRTPKGKPVKESYVIAILLWTLLLGVGTEATVASLTPAAMIMGLIIPDGPPLGATIIQKCELIISEFFLPLFYIRIGYFTNLSAIQDWRQLVVFGAAMVVGYLGRMVGSILVSSSFNMGKTSAVLLSLILSLQGIMELLQGIKWKHQQLIDDQNFATLVMSILILNAIITPIIQICYKPEVAGFDLPTIKPRFKSLQMTSSIGELRIITCIQEEENVPSIISLLEALNPKEVNPICAYVIHLVALASQTVPTLSPYKNHKRKFSTPTSSDNIMRAFLNYAEHTRFPVQIQPFRMISPFKYMHQPICRLAETMRIPLIVVPFFKSEEVHSTDGTLRIFNTNIQAFAKCTVGILVDRGLRTHISLTTFSYNVALIFLGGTDDREALAFAARMSSHPNITITVLRIHWRRRNTLEFEIEKEVDESFFRDFKAMNDGNACVACHDLVAHDSEEVINALGSLSKNNFDLVVVGKRQGIAEFEEKLISWTEYPELGVIGDAIAAPGFCGGMMSVLVLQHHDDGHLSESPRCSTYISC